MTQPDRTTHDLHEEPDPDELDDRAVAAAEQHQRAEEDADPEERVVVQDAETGATEERPAQ